MSAANTKPRIVAEVPLFRGFIRVDRYTLQAEWKGRTVRMDREIHFHGHAAAILPVDPGRRTGILIRQFRVAPLLDGESGWLWEIPAGLLDDEAPRICAAREAEEEAGVAIGDIEALGKSYASPGLVRECVELFWGRYSTPPSSATGGLDEEAELIEVHELPMSEIGRMAENGDITDSKSAVAIFRLKARRPDLFETANG